MTERENTEEARVRSDRGKVNILAQKSWSAATAVVLTGGKSSRMGSPKALLLFDGEPLIVHIVRVLNELFGEIVVVAAPEQELPPLPAKLVRDEVGFQGPVGGMYYGLRAAAGEVSFVTSCDVAFLNPQLISYLLSEIVNYEAVVPYWEDRLQPLHAVYRRSVVPLLERQLERRELRPIYLFDKVRTRKLTADEVRRFDPEGLSFFNMNTPEDYQTALRRWRGLSQTPGRQPKTEMETERAPGSVAPFTCSVELFGTAQLLAKTKAISVSLPDPATLADVFMAVAEQLPMLAGRVVDTGRSRLNSGFACNINGVEFVRDPAVKINRGDKILILAADAGG